MAKQTFTTGQVLTAAQMTSLQQTAMLGGAANAKVASYVLVAADAGDSITMSNASPTTITVNTGLFAAGDIVTIINLGAGTTTITAGTATVDTSGSLVLATNQGGVLRFTSASAAIFFQFATPASGDIEGVTAGTGISGGGTSGTVTVTNSMATAIDAKGDLIVGTGADTFSRLAVGTNTYTLVADSGETTGLRWAAPASGKVKQIVFGTLTSTASTTSTSYTDTGITASITPSSASNKILVLATICEGLGGSSASSFLTLANGSDTNLINPDSPGSRTVGITRTETQAALAYDMWATSLVFNHAPATTSSYTYKIRYRVESGATAFINRSSSDDNAVYTTRGVSTITLIEYEV